jgi:nucleotidyltransferase substrate binding protein (TIGR01987 family)
MSAPPDHRFKQKSNNFAKALRALEKAVELPISEPRDLSGIIKDFEIVYELSWVSLKIYLEGQGHSTGSARDAFAKAYQIKQIDDEAIWLEMIRDRNLTVHTYNEELARELVGHIRDRYLPALQKLSKLFSK